MIGLLLVIVFTALPVGVYAVTDLDLKESDGDIVKKFMPLLYKESREIYPIFSLSIFIKSLIKGFISSFLIFYIVCFCDLGSEIIIEVIMVLYGGCHLKLILILLFLLI